MKSQQTIFRLRLAVAAFAALSAATRLDAEDTDHASAIVLMNQAGEPATIRAGDKSATIPASKARVLKPAQFPVSLEYRRSRDAESWESYAFAKPGVYDFRLVDDRWTLTKRTPVMLTNLAKSPATLQLGKRRLEIPAEKFQLLQLQKLPLEVLYWTGNKSLGWQKEVLSAGGIYDLNYVTDRWTLVRRRGGGAPAAVSRPSATRAAQPVATARPMPGPATNLRPRGTAGGAGRWGGAAGFGGGGGGGGGGGFPGGGGGFGGGGGGGGGFGGGGGGFGGGGGRGGMGNLASAINLGDSLLAGALGANDAKGANGQGEVINNTTNNITETDSNNSTTDSNNNTNSNNTSDSNNQCGSNNSNSNNQCDSNNTDSNNTDSNNTGPNNTGPNNTGPNNTGSNNCGQNSNAPCSGGTPSAVGQLGDFATAAGDVGMVVGGVETDDPTMVVAGAVGAASSVPQAYNDLQGDLGSLACGLGCGLGLTDGGGATSGDPANGDGADQLGLDDGTMGCGVTDPTNDDGSGQCGNSNGGCGNSNGGCGATSGGGCNGGCGGC